MGGLCYFQCQESFPISCRTHFSAWTLIIQPCSGSKRKKKQTKKKTSSDHRQRPDSMSSKAQQARLQTLHGNPEIWDLSPDRTGGLHGCFTDAAAASSSCFPVPTDRARHAAATLRAHIPTLPSATQTNTRACGSGPHPQRSTAELSISSKTLFST